MIHPYQRKKMTNTQQQIIRFTFILFPLALIVIFTYVMNMELSHPFILLNISLITMGASLSNKQWLFGVGLIMTLLLMLYAAAMLPSQEAIDATNKALKKLEDQQTPTTVFSALTKK